MRKAIFIFIAIILVAVSVDWIDACSEVRTDKDMFKRNLTYAEMYEYKDSAYDFYSKFIRNGKFVCLYDALSRLLPRCAHSPVQGDRWLADMGASAPKN